MKSKEFKMWLSQNTNYGHKTISDISSRANRANKILPWTPDPVYLFLLEQNEEYKALSSIIRSQMKAAVKLYTKFMKQDVQGEEITS